MVSVIGGKERDRLRRLERHCDWLAAKISEAEVKGKDAGLYKGELSALRWAIELITAPEGPLLVAHGKLRTKIANQRKALRAMIAYHHRITVADNELDAVVDAAEIGRLGKKPVEGEGLKQ